MEIKEGNKVYFFADECGNGNGNERRATKINLMNLIEFIGIF